MLKHNIVCQKPEDSLQQIKYAAVRKFQAEGNHSLRDPNINSKSWQKIKAAMKHVPYCKDHYNFIYRFDDLWFLCVISHLFAYFLKFNSIIRKSWIINWQSSIRSSILLNIEKKKIFCISSTYIPISVLIKFKKYAKRFYNQINSDNTKCMGTKFSSKSSYIRLDAKPS